MARDFTRLSSHYLESLTSPVTGPPFTLACWVRTDDASVNEAIVGLAADAAPDEHLLYYAGGSNQLWAFSAAGGGFSVSTQGAITANAWTHVGGVWASASSRIAYLDGAAGADAGGARTPTVARLNVGREWYNGGAGAHWSGRIAELAMWDVALTDAEMASLAKGFSPLLVRPGNLVLYAPLVGRTSPEIDVVGGYGLTVSGAAVAEHPRVFSPRPGYVGVGSVGGTVYELAADAGSVAITGTAATLSYGRSLTAEAGTYSVTGTAAGLALGLSVLAESGTYAIAGTAAALTRTATVSASSGSFTITGTAAGLALGRVVVAEAGSVVITGSDASLQYGNAYNLDVDAGTFTVNGTAAVLTLARVLVAEPGGFAITGSVAGVAIGLAVLADAGSFAVTGTAAGLSYGRSLTADAGVYAWTGTALDFLHARVLIVASGAYVWTGTDADLTTVATIDPAPIYIVIPADDHTIVIPADDHTIVIPAE